MQDRLLFRLNSKLYANAGYLWLSGAAFALLGFAFWNVVARLHSPENRGRLTAKEN